MQVSLRFEGQSGAKGGAGVAGQIQEVHDCIRHSLLTTRDVSSASGVYENGGPNVHVKTSV